MRGIARGGLLCLAALGLIETVPASAAPPSVVSAPTPFVAGCNGPPQSGTAFFNSEIEPYVDVNPRDPDNLVAVYQQDRWSNGGANGNLASVSFDGGQTWTRPPLGDQPRFSRCAGGSEANGGDFERASDPWVTFGPNGDAFQAAVSFNDTNSDQAELVSRSTDGGLTWGPNVTLLREADPNISNERPAITADYTDADNVYVVWDRDVSAPKHDRLGPTLFARTTDDGASWETPRVIYEPRRGNQTSGNQIVVMPDGDLLNFFDEFDLGTQSVHPRRDRITVIRSSDEGTTWSKGTLIAHSLVVGVTDPRDGATVRIGDIFPEVASDERPGTDNVYAVWEDTRFTVGQRHQIAFSRSTDGGRKWSKPIRVSANPATQAFVPSIDVDDAGNLAVAYYDFSADTTASPTLDTQYWITRSTDEGRTWSPRQEITNGPFDMRSAPLSGGYFLGEYNGLESAGTAFKVVAAFANSGNAANPSDIFSTTFP
jgi:hypothetical protein